MDNNLKVQHGLHVEGASQTGQNSAVTVSAHEQPSMHPAGQINGGLQTGAESLTQLNPHVKMTKTEAQKNALRMSDVGHNIVGGGMGLVINNNSNENFGGS